MYNAIMQCIQSLPGDPFPWPCVKKTNSTNNNTIKNGDLKIVRKLIKK